MRVRAAALSVGALLVITTAGAAFGQGFQGGLRGSIKDAGGVIPGVEVALTNAQVRWIFILTVILLPGAVVLTGIGVWLWRRR